MPEWIRKLFSRPRSAQQERFRAILPDAQDSTRVVLYKACAELRLTYEIKLATYFALKEGRRLVIALPTTSSVHPTAQSYFREHRVEIRRG